MKMTSKTRVHRSDNVRIQIPFINSLTDSYKLLDIFQFLKNRPLSCKYTSGLWKFAGSYCLMLSCRHFCIGSHNCLLTVLI
ncbi:hypothetical protein GDO78_009594 [Eleutherodactylus coqui]|uniref:Uncharacterized protein n=1 Tax=Eleutherodactylus coqui TaxID=57060 RepID=A0A8J6FAJ7_ELECQ|nr:hypothetical protein GDO78_009594 [Eleutherodactylus coqui]